MSILIKDMEMPKGCFDCPFERDYAFICSLTNKETRKHRKVHVVNEYEAMPEWCPLVEVPPHGRLIDADKLNGDLIKEKTRMAELAHISEDFKYMAQAFGLNKARILTMIQQTIIEAEGEKEDG